MTKEELLAKAKRDYPIGTKYKSALDNYYDGESDGDFEYVKYEDGDIAIDCNGRFVYNNGKWAEIISYSKGYNKEINYEIY